MKSKQVMLIAGEASGDLLAAELVPALREALTAADIAYPRDPQPVRTGLEPRFFGAGGPRLAAAGVELAFDLTAHSVIGLSDVPKSYLRFRRMFHQLLRLAHEREPDLIVCVDFSVFNHRFAHAIRQALGGRSDWFHDWRPKIVKYVSPQVWASRERRAYQMARDFDLLLSIFPFEPEWYASRVPGFRVEFVGHPMVDRFATAGSASIASARPRTGEGPFDILLLPGSRTKELQRHVPVMLGAWKQMREAIPAIRARMVLPGDPLVQLARSLGVPSEVAVRHGGLSEALGESDLALASTGTVTMECAFHQVPTVTLYKTSWSNYQIGKRIVRVKSLTMPNLLAKEEVFPEFIQNAATPENLARAGLELLRNEARRKEIRGKLARIIASLGLRGANRRAARSIVDCLEHEG